MTVNVDANLENADWLRSRTWDLFTPDNKKLITTYDELAASLLSLSERGANERQVVEAFLKLPAARPMPKELKAELKGKGYNIP